MCTCVFSVFVGLSCVQDFVLLERERMHTCCLMNYACPQYGYFCRQQWPSTSKSFSDAIHSGAISEGTGGREKTAQTYETDARETVLDVLPGEVKLLSVRN